MYFQGKSSYAGYDSSISAIVEDVVGNREEEEICWGIGKWIWGTKISLKKDQGTGTYLYLSAI
jgi:hypothetical protein